jgi:pyruvate formate lyase activating enzyme
LGFYKVTFNDHGGISRASIYNSGCNFRCLGCAYRLREEQESKPELDDARLFEMLGRLKPKRVHFLGGEPTSNCKLASIARFAQEELGALTKIGHSNGSGRIPDHIDEASISIKAIDDSIHKYYTGASNKKVLENFHEAFERGIALHASTVLIPGLVGSDEVESISAFIALMDRQIPLHITGYIPAPGTPWRAPSSDEMETAAKKAKAHLKNVAFRSIDSGEFARLREKDPLYCSLRIL